MHPLAQKEPLGGTRTYLWVQQIRNVELQCKNKDKRRP